VVERFMAAVSTGDLQGLMDVLSPDVVLVTDGGGKKQAALRPIHGVEKVLRFLSAVMPDDGTASAAPTLVNGSPGLRLLLGDELDTIATMRVDDGRVTALYLVRNPDKLARVDEAVGLAR
jgi:RNA polymerase sigma-70 factor (ECF subfamily)